MNNVYKLLTLSSGDIHLYVSHSNTIDDPGLLRKYEKLLSSSESDTYYSFNYLEQRKSFLIAKALIRNVLSHYVEKPIESWDIRYSVLGKPYVACPDKNLNFNISHTQNLVVCAISTSHNIGVDIEYIDEDRDVINISKKCFSKDEIKTIQGISDRHLQLKKFYEVWTLNEAFVKASGRGMEIPVDDFSVCVLDASDGGYVNDNINICIHEPSSKRPRNTKNWLLSLYPSHQLALSVIGDTNAVFSLRIFEGVPLEGFDEVDRVSLSPFPCRQTDCG